MHTDESRQNPWALTFNTVVIEIQTFCLHRNTNSLTEKWLTSSVIPTSDHQDQIVITVQKYTVLTIWPKHQLPNVCMTDEVCHFSVRKLAFRCKKIPGVRKQAVQRKARLIFRSLCVRSSSTTAFFFSINFLPNIYIYIWRIPTQIDLAVTLTIFNFFARNMLKGVPKENTVHEVLDFLKNFLGSSRKVI